MNVKRIKALMFFDFIFYFKNISLFIYKVLFDVLLFSYIYFANIISISRNQSINILLIFIFITTLLVNLVDVPFQEIRKRETKYMKRILVSPVTKVEYIVSEMIGQYILLSLAIIIMIFLTKQILTFKSSFAIFMFYTIYYIFSYVLAFSLAQFMNTKKTFIAVNIFLGAVFLLLILVPFLKYFLPFNILLYLFSHSDLTFFEIGLSVSYLVIYLSILFYISFKKFRWE